MDGILNETTNTVHKRVVGIPDLETPCGITNNVPEDRLSRTAVGDIVTTTSATKCGLCFDGGGY